MKICKVFYVGLFITALSLSVFAEEKKDDKVKAEDKIVETTHCITINGEEIHYTARTGAIVMKKDDDTPRAKLFFVAYEKEGVQDKSKRPVTFAFNGGPGSSSVWMHIGVLGPQRVDLDENGYPVSLPFTLVDNQYSILDQTDLVFIDPISTGFSRTIGDTNPSEFHGIQGDIESVGEFIRLYATRYNRWGSPKFLAGESYGTTRASGLSNYLLERHGMYLNGIILVSSILNFQTLDFSSGNELAYILYLPTYTASAWYHKKLDQERLNKPLTDVLKEANEFALGDYAAALFKGSNLPAGEREKITEKLSVLTGLSKDYIKKTNLRISIFRYTKELLRDEMRTIGRYDSRYKGIDQDSAGDSPEYDPSFSVVQGAYTSAFNQYVRTSLKFESDQQYEILTGRVHPWNWNSQNSYVNVADDLRKAITKNPYMNVMVLCGYYDLATPYLAAEYTFDHLGVDALLRQNIHFSYYEAGHMMYLHKPSLRNMKKNMDTFIKETVEKSSKPIQKF